MITIMKRLKRLFHRLMQRFSTEGKGVEIPCFDVRMTNCHILQYIYSCFFLCYTFPLFIIIIIIIIINFVTLDTYRG